MDQASTITVDGVNHEVSKFSPEVQQAVGIYNAIVLDLQKSQLEVIKCQAALQSVGNQISAAVKAELEKKVEAVPVSVESAESAS